MNSFEINQTEIEMKARQLRAEAIRDTFKRFAAWTRGLLAGIGGQTAH